MSSQSDYNNLLRKIKNLQTAQKRLQTELNSLPPNNNFKRQQLLVTQIDDINAEKVQLFKNLASLSFTLQDDYNESTNDLKARTEMLKLVEEQLESSRRRLEAARNENINNLRMSEINNYYSGYYNIYLQLFRYIIYTCVFLVLVVFLRQRFVINNNITNVLAFIIITIGGFFIITTLWDFSNRNNLVINQYDFPFDPHSSKNPTHDGSDFDIGGEWMDELNHWKNDIELLEKGECLGPSCCVGDGLTFDDQNMICKLDPGKKEKNEGFTDGGKLNPAPLGETSDKMIVNDLSGDKYAIF